MGTVEVVGGRWSVEGGRWKVVGSRRQVIGDAVIQSNGNGTIG
jgi:hypothetical protein